MIVTFNYSEQGVTDPRPILLFLHKDTSTKNIEGLNLNYLNPTKLKKYSKKKKQLKRKNQLSLLLLEFVKIHKNVI